MVVPIVCTRECIDIKIDFLYIEKSPYALVVVGVDGVVFWSGYSVAGGFCDFIDSSFTQF